MYHVSENKIEVFYPRKSPLDAPIHGDFVWAIGEKLLHNYVLPRDCPRVCYYPKTFSQMLSYSCMFNLDKKPFVVAVPQYMFDTILNTKLYIHQFAPFNFKLIDEIANYYVSAQIETCINIFEINNILAYFDHNPFVELKFIKDLEEL
ncbi:MAG: hypothetical protein RLZZ414_793, partial [Bacteroidota bacterium]